MLVSALLYTFGCIACAAAPAMPVLLAGRTVQGLGGGALVAWCSSPNRFFPDRLVQGLSRAFHCLDGLRAQGPLIGGAFATAGVALRLLVVPGWCWRRCCIRCSPGTVRCAPGRQATPRCAPTCSAERHSRDFVCGGCQFDHCLGCAPAGRVSVRVAIRRARRHRVSPLQDCFQTMQPASPILSDAALR